MGSGQERIGDTSGITETELHPRGSGFLTNGRSRIGRAAVVTLLAFVGMACSISTEGGQTGPSVKAEQYSPHIVTISKTSALEFSLEDPTIKELIQQIDDRCGVAGALPDPSNFSRLRQLHLVTNIANCASQLPHAGVGLK